MSRFFFIFSRGSPISPFSSHQNSTFWFLPFFFSFRILQFSLHLFKSFHIPTHSFHFILSHLWLGKIVHLTLYRYINLYIMPVVWTMRDTHHVLLHWTLSLSEHRLGQKGPGITDHDSSAQGSAYYWQNESYGNAGGSGTATVTNLLTWTWHCMAASLYPYYVSIIIFLDLSA